MSITPFSPPGAPDPADHRTILLSQIVFLLFCLEVGLVLLLLPWTLLWDNNYFFSLQPRHGSLWLSNYLRGAISGLGMVNLWMAVEEIQRIRRR